MTSRDFQSLMDIISRPTTRHARVEGIKAMILDLGPRAPEAFDLIDAALALLFDDDEINHYGKMLLDALERHQLDSGEDPQDEKMELRIARREA